MGAVPFPRPAAGSLRGQDLLGAFERVGVDDRVVHRVIGEDPLVTVVPLHPGIRNQIKVQPSASVNGHFSKDRFAIDLDQATVTCPAGVVAPIAARSSRHAGIAYFDDACTYCPLRGQCVSVAGGRTITIGAHENASLLAASVSTTPVWKADHRATCPKVERKIGHLMCRWHSGRRARVRGGRRSTPTSGCSPWRSISPAWQLFESPTPPATRPPPPPDNRQHPER